MEYPQGISDELEQRSYLLTGEMKELRAQVKLWIPKTYFEEQTAEAHLSSMVLIVLMILLGLVLCLVFSKMAASKNSESISSTYSFVGCGRAYDFTH